MFCSKCGSNINANARFCGVCGNPINVFNQPVPPQVTPQAQPQVTPQAPPQAQPQVRPPMPQPPQPPQARPPMPPHVRPPMPPSPQYSVPVAPPSQPQQQRVAPPVPQAAPQQAAPQQAAPRPVAAPQPIPPQPPYIVPASQQGTLNSTIFGGNLPAVSIRLNTNESIYTQAGGMAWMDDGITMSTNMQGGLMKGLGRMLSGDSLFMATYTATRPNQEVVISSTFPGSILEIQLYDKAIIAQKSAFLCAQQSVTLSAFMTKSIGAGLFGGEGFVLQRLSGAGKVFLEVDGSLAERTLAPGEKIKVESGHIAAFEETCVYQAEMVKGFKNILFGGEGLFLATLTGPGKVWLQTITIPGFAKMLIPFLPKPTSN